MTHTFNYDKGSIRLVVSHLGKKYRRSTGVSIDPKLWNPKAKTLSGRCGNKAVLAHLKVIHIRLEEKEDIVRTEKDVLAAIDYALSGEDDVTAAASKRKGEVPSFYEYFRVWADSPSPQVRQRRNILNLIHNCMGDNYDWDTIDSAFYFRLIERLKEREYGVNYIGAVIAKIKTVMGNGYRLKYHHNLDFQGFKKPSEQADTIYLTKEEVLAIESVELKDSMRRKVRDLFIVGCYTAMRFSDYSRLTLENIDEDGYIRFVQQKTSTTVVLPASPKVIAILERNGGVAPRVCQQVFNRHIKGVAKLAGITQKIPITKSKGARHITQMLPKYTQITSHTARRTGATLLYQSGVPASACMMITGHGSESSFFRYIRTTQEENAKLLADNPFFK